MLISVSTFFIHAFMVVITSCEIMESIHRQALVRGLRLSEYFRDHDKLRTGICSVSALKSVLTRLNLHLSTEQLGTIISTFGESTSFQFRYRSFLEELDRRFKSEVDTEADVAEKHIHSPVHAINNKAHVWTKGQVPVISLLQAQVYERRVDFREFFLDFDPLRKGSVSESNLRSILALLNFEVTEDEIAEILSSYGTCKPPKIIDYHALCLDVERALICPPMDHDPLSLPPPNFDLVATKEGKKAVLNQLDLDTIREIESTIRRRITQRGINLLGHFRSFDNHGRLVITGSQFGRVLATLGFNINPHEVELLCKKYCMSGSSSRFAYRKFCDSIAD